MSQEKKLHIRNRTAEFLIFTRQAGDSRRAHLEDIAPGTADFPVCCIAGFLTCGPWQYLRLTSYPRSADWEIGDTAGLETGGTGAARSPIPTPYANGVAPPSPGLRRRSYPGSLARSIPNPNGVVPASNSIGYCLAKKVFAGSRPGWLKMQNVGISDRLAVRATIRDFRIVQKVFLLLRPGRAHSGGGGNFVFPWRARLGMLATG